MKTCASSLVLASLCAANVSAIDARRGTRNNQTDRRLKSSSNGVAGGGSGSGKGKKSKSGKGGDFFYLSFLCAPDDSGLNLGGGDQFQKTCLTATQGMPLNPDISDEFAALTNLNIGARCCGSDSAESQRWRFNKVNDFYVTIQNEATGKCLQSPVTCIFGDTNNGPGFGSLDLGTCDPNNDRYLFNVANLSIASKTCRTEGALSSTIIAAGCTDGIFVIPPALFVSTFLAQFDFDTFSPATSANSLAGNCDVGVCDGEIFGGFLCD